MALALISASVMVLVVFLDADTSETDPIQADRAGETAASTTMSVSYSVEPVTENDEAGIFDGGSGSDDLPSHTFTRQAHGTVASLLAQAAIANVEFWGEPLTVEGEQFVESIDGQFRSEVTGKPYKVRMEAIWRPYEGAQIEGHAEVGPPVPEHVDVNSATMTVPSGFEDVSEEVREARENGDDHFEESAQAISRAIVEGLLPESEMQRALERQGVDRKLAAYRYDRFSRIVVEYDPKLPAYGFYEGGNLDRDTVNARHLNNRLVGNLSTSVGSVLLGQGMSEPIAEDIEETFGSSVHADDLADAMTTDEVVILIRTWETEPLEGVDEGSDVR